MQVNHLNFSQEEMDVLLDKRFFLVKHAAMQKIMELFGNLEGRMKLLVENHPICLVPGLNTEQGKIFRGENYRLLPYMVLDYPRLFSKSSVLSFRSMFWWGNFFSFTLHMQGKAFQEYGDRLLSRLDAISSHDFFICVNSTPWEYHFEEKNYIPVSEFLRQGRREAMEEKGFLKLSRRLSLNEYKNAIAYGEETIRLLLLALS